LRVLARDLIQQAQDTERDDYIPPAVKEKLIKALQAKAQESAHPALTSQPLIGEDNSDEKPKPRMTQARLLRSAYTERA